MDEHGEFQYFINYVDHVISAMNSSVMMCMLTLGAHMAKLTQTILTAPHDSDMLNFVGGETMFYIFWLMKHVGMKNYSLLPRELIISTRRNRISMAADLAAANKNLSRGCSNSVNRLWRGQEEEFRELWTAIKQAVQAILNATSTIDVHGLLERSIQGHTIERVLKERRQQIIKRKTLAFELESNSVYPILYKVKAESSIKFKSLLTNSGVDTKTTHTLESLALKLHTYVSTLTRRYSTSSVKIALTDVLGVDWELVNLTDNRSFMYPLFENLENLPYAKTWNKRYPRRSRLWDYWHMPIMEIVEDSFEMIHTTEEDEKYVDYTNITPTLVNINPDTPVWKPNLFEETLVSMTPEPTSPVQTETVPSQE